MTKSGSSTLPWETPKLCTMGCALSMLLACTLWNLPGLDTFNSWLITTGQNMLMWVSCAVASKPLSPPATYSHCVALPSSSPCQNGGTCADADGSAASPSCLCPPGFSGDFCEISADSCQPNPCLNGGNCTNHGLAFSCVCPHGFTGFTCNDTVSLLPCAGRPCANRGTCVDQPDGTFRCVCQKWFSGPTCSLQHRPKAKPKLVSAKPVEHGVFALMPQHYSLPAHTFHKLLRPPERDLLKVTLKETVHSPGVLVTHGQLVCFGMLALLTCLVILGTMGIVFFGRCETWLANAKYSQLVRQQREHLLREAGGASQEEPEHSVNIILPEKIRLTSFGRHYTSIWLNRHSLWSPLPREGVLHERLKIAANTMTVVQLCQQSGRY